MLCKGTLEEKNRRINCWLPAEETSEFGFCRRCHFHHITAVLDSLSYAYVQGVPHPVNESLMQKTTFLYELLHPAREQALLNLLVSLFLYNTKQFEEVISTLQKKHSFSILLTNRIRSHQPGPRCKLYRRFLKDTSFYKAEDLCWNCWDCIVWSLTQKERHLYERFQEQYIFEIARINVATFNQIGSHVLKELFTVLYLLGNDTCMKVLLEHLFHELPIESFKQFLASLFQQVPMIEILFQEKRNKYIPLALQDEVVIDEFKKKCKVFIKKRSHIFKEELMIKTWHPSRLFAWCFDLDDLSDFTDTQWNPEWLDESVVTQFQEESSFGYIGRRD